MLTQQQIIAKALLSIYNPVGVEKLAVTGTVVSLTPPVAIASIVRYALIEVEAASTADYLRYWQSGDTPSSTDGIKRPDGSAFDLIGAAAISKFRGIGVGAGCTLQIQYFS